VSHCLLLTAFRLLLPTALRLPHSSLQVVTPMRKCPYCVDEGQEEARVCNWCYRTVA